MDQDDRQVMTKLEWGVLFAIITSAASIVFSAGIVWTQLQIHEREILALKVKDDSNTDRLARIETKLDVLLGGKGVQEGGR